MVKDGWFDCHCHTWNSPDSKSDPEKICLSAIEKGLSGVSFTDHCNVNYYPDVDVLSVVLASHKDAQRMSERFSGSLKVLRGVELGNHAYNQEIVKRVLDIGGYDIVVGSVHAVSYMGYDQNISRIDLQSFPEELVHGYLDVYFKEILRTVSNEDIDALAHIAFGVRYMALPEGRRIDVSGYLDTIDFAFREMIRCSIALEININNVVPRREIFGRIVMTVDGAMRELKVEQFYYELVKRYYAMGGRLITLGSDAHTPENVGRNFGEVVAKLKEIGFREGCYFQNREVKFYTL